MSFFHFRTFYHSHLFSFNSFFYLLLRWQSMQLAPRFVHKNQTVLKNWDAWSQVSIIWALPINWDLYEAMFSLFHRYNNIHSGVLSKTVETIKRHFCDKFGCHGQIPWCLKLLNLTVKLEESCPSLTHLRTAMQPLVCRLHLLDSGVANAEHISQMWRKFPVVVLLCVVLFTEPSRVCSVGCTS